MSLISRNSAGTHNHLARKAKKHVSPKQAADGLQAETGAEEAPKKDPPFGKLQFGAKEGNAPAAYKPIFRI